MANTTKIAWADSTFNPWIGCTAVSPACDHCYARANWQDRKHRVTWGAGQPRSRTKTWGDPVRWARKRFMQCNACGWRGELAAEVIGCGSCGSTDHLQDTRRRVFCASLADVFDNDVPVWWRWDLFRLIAATPNLDWLLLTKRIGNAHAMMAQALGGTDTYSRLLPLPNVWLGATICDQREADRDVPKLLATPAAVRFLSIEPMLGTVDLQMPLNIARSQRGWFKLQQFSDSDGRSCGGGQVSWVGPHHTDLHWVICGGESGPHARPMHPDWARSLRDQCAAAGVAFFFKQWGEWVPRGPESMGYPLIDHVPRVRLTDRGHNGQHLNSKGGNDCWMQRSGTKAAGRLLDGRTHDEFPR